MATINSFTATWNPNTYEVTLDWELLGTSPAAVVHVKAGRLGAFVAAAQPNTHVLPGAASGTGEFTLQVDDGPNPVVKKTIVVVYERSLEEHPPFVNAGFDWLTYETVLNKPKFRKTNQSRSVGLYAVDMADLQLWIRSDMPDGSFKALCAAFFPDHRPAEIQSLSDASWWWKQQAQQSELESLKGEQAPYFKAGGAQPPPEDIPAWLPRSEPGVVASRAVLKLFLPRYAVLPYNFWDNERTSRSIGTAGSDKFHPIPMIQIKRELADANSWEMWRTASRSCVMKVSRVKESQVPWPAMDWREWDFGQANQRALFANKEKDRPVYKNDAFKADVQGVTKLELRKLDESYFGVKTGVSFVGFAEQSEKQIIGQGGEWLCGSMRSDTIQAVRKLARAKMAVARDDIVIQTETMMLMERKMSPAMARERFGAGNQDPGVDGVALRDLTVLDKSKYYVPPLSIPFISKDMCTLCQEFAFVDDVEWRGFWQRNWAEGLGQAKALFLVQYGMQHANPNVQNYLLEFSVSPAEAIANYIHDPTTKQARVVIRDVADALLVREVAWALFGPAGACPQGVTAGDARDLATMRLPVLRYNFRSADQAQANETGSTDRQFGPPGIQFLWNRFSGFYVGNKPGKNNECPSERLEQALRLTSQWGIAHSAAYVRTVERALGQEFGAIRWDEIYDEAHHPDRFLIAGRERNVWKNNCESSSKTDMDWEEEAARHICSFLNTDAGRSKLCEYHNRGWLDVQAAFCIRLVDDAGKPLALRVVYCAERASGKILAARMTDPAGEIPFFDKRYQDYAFWVSEGPFSKLTYADGSSRQVGARITLDLVRQDGVIWVVKPQATALAIAITGVTVTDPGQPVTGSASPIKAVPTPGPGQSIVSVRFLLAGKPLTAPVSSTHETTLDTTLLKNGKYALTAEATDSGGATITSRALSIDVYNPLPTVTITAPAPGVMAGDVTFTANATAGAGMTMKSVQFNLPGSKNIGSEILAQPPSSTFTVVIPSADFKIGASTIVAIAEDTAGNVQTSASIDVTVNGSRPDVTVTAVQGAGGGNFTLAANPRPGLARTLKSVQFKIDGADRGAPLASGPYTMDLDRLTLKNGQHSVTAVATDTGGEATTSASVGIVVDNPRTVITLRPPAWPAANGMVLTADVQVGAGLTLKSVQFIVDDEAHGKAVTAPPYESDEIEVFPGNYTIKVKATDTVGNVTLSLAMPVQVP